MKRLIIIQLLILGLLFSIYSCESPKSEKHIQIEKENKIEKPKKDITLKLDSGNLWIANTETTEGVNRMTDIMNSFTESENKIAYSELTEKLKTEFTSIFVNCTMKGEAHNQLHNFLIPINDLFKTLSSNDLNKCKNSFEKLNLHLKKYEQFFK